MRRFSQRNSLVTLNDINITPLLDLAFVLLIIFVITRPLIEQSIDLNLPNGGREVMKPDMQLEQRIEISPQGNYKLNGVSMTLNQILPNVDAAFKRNANSYVAIRADQSGAYKYVADVLDGCQKRGISRFSLRTQPEKR
jgi:biopolymer transport protein ExbD